MMSDRKKPTMMSDVGLREVRAEDMSLFFAHQRDAESQRMVPFLGRDPEDREIFDAHWAKILADRTVVIRTVLVDGAVAGHVMCFERLGAPEVGYWFGREWWGRGVATRALELLLEEITTRPDPRSCRDRQSRFAARA